MALVVVPPHGGVAVIAEKSGRALAACWPAACAQPGQPETLKVSVSKNILTTFFCPVILRKEDGARLQPVFAAEGNPGARIESRQMAALGVRADP
jgi:hypothetical protein